MGRAYIRETAKQWQEAAALFDKVSDLLPEDTKVGLRSREEYGWCLCHSGEVQSAIAVLQVVLDSLKAIEEDRSLDVARCLWRLGTCHWDLDGELYEPLTSRPHWYVGTLHKEDAYKYFIASLKANSSFAPAFTSLGIYYGEFANPPDPTRAAKCFQKAFELDAREVEAARRLARSFADDKEWDLVEVVAKRTIEGEGGLDAGLGTETRYLPTNAWAWKALGVVELVSVNKISQHTGNGSPAIAPWRSLCCYTGVPNRFESRSRRSAVLAATRRKLRSWWAACGCAEGVEASTAAGPRRLAAVVLDRGGLFEDGLVRGGDWSAG